MQFSGVVDRGSAAQQIFDATAQNCLNRLLSTVLVGGAQRWVGFILMPGVDTRTNRGEAVSD